MFKEKKRLISENIQDAVHLSFSWMLREVKFQQKKVDLFNL